MTQLCGPHLSDFNVFLFMLLSHIGTYLVVVLSFFAFHVSYVYIYPRFYCQYHIHVVTFQLHVIKMLEHSKPFMIKKLRIIK